MTSDRDATLTSSHTRGAHGCVQERQAEISAWGDGSPTREFLYVEDASEGILPSAALRTRLAAERYNQSDPVNPSTRLRAGIGSATETCPPWTQPSAGLCKRTRGISIKDLTETSARLTGFEGRIAWDTSKSNGQPRRKLDVSRARERFGFEALTSFEAGLQQTVSWYTASRSAAD